MMVDKIGYLVSALAWSGVGFLAGVWVTLASNNIRRIADALDRPTPGDETVSTDTPPARRLRRPSFRTIVGVVVLLLALVSVVTTSIQQERISTLVVNNEAQAKQSREIVRCLSAFANGFADALEARSEPSAEAQAALDELMTRINQVINNPDPDADRVALRKELQDAFADYQTKRTHAREQQQQNPFPPSPREC